MPDTSAAREEIRDAYEHHRNVMGGMSMALMKLEVAAGLMRREDPPPEWSEDDPVWIDDALLGLTRAAEACRELAQQIESAQAEVTMLADEASSRQLPDEARCRVSLRHQDGTEAPCTLRRSHQRDDSDHVDEHGHTAPVLVSWATIQEVRHVQAMREMEADRA